MTAYAEQIYKDKRCETLSYPKRELIRRYHWENPFPQGITNNTPLFEVSYREEDDPLIFSRYETYIRIFVQFELAKYLNITLFDYLSLTKEEADILLRIVKEKIQQEQVLTEKENQKLEKSMQMKGEN